MPVPLDVVIVIDRSGSMDDLPDNRIYWAKLAANNLVDQLADGDDRPRAAPGIGNLIRRQQRSDPPPGP